MILAGDIGGTKAELALFENVSQRKVIKEGRFLCKEFKSLEEIVQKFLADVSYEVSCACFGIAGPIENNRCQATNLPWVVEGQKLQTLIKTPFVFLLNDLEANAWGIFALNKEELYTLSSGIEEKKGNKALISAGTGLGESCLYFDGVDYHPFASEGGHVNFAPCNEEEVELWRYFSAKFGHVSYERLLCGSGFFNIYQFFVDVKREKELPEVRERIQKEDPAKVINEYGSSGKCIICQKTLRLFASIYGSEAGNVALKFLSLGGLYIGGGIAPKILETLKAEVFLQSFKAKGRFHKLLSGITIQVILNPKTALLGAARYAESRKKRE